MKADAVLIDGIIVDDDAVQKSRAHFILVVPRSSERIRSGCFQLLSVLDSSRLTPLTLLMGWEMGGRR